jgi:hypothetical protein
MSFHATRAEAALKYSPLSEGKKKSSVWTAGVRISRNLTPLSESEVEVAV